MATTTLFRNLVKNEKGLLDRRVFGDPDIYQQELEQIFGRCWLFLGHETQVPKPNDFIATYGTGKGVVSGEVRSIAG